MVVVKKERDCDALPFIMGVTYGCGYSVCDCSMDDTVGNVHRLMMSNERSCDMVLHTMSNETIARLTSGAIATQQ